LAAVNTHEWLNDLDVVMFQGSSPALLTFASVCCVVYMMVGVPGNLITIIALFRCKKVSDDFSYTDFSVNIYSDCTRLHSDYTPTRVHWIGVVLR